jgi:acyl-CoA thioester hydrolase
MKELETYRGAVYPWHCDFMGHMNVMHYVGKFDQATWHLLAHIGITPSYLQQQNKGMVAAEQHLKYFAELIAGDLIYIKTTVLEIKPKAVIFLHKMYNAETGVLCAEGRMVGIHIDKTIRKSENFPAHIYAQLNALK